MTASDLIPADPVNEPEPVFLANPIRHPTHEPKIHSALCRAHEKRGSVNVGGRLLNFKRLRSPQSQRQLQDLDQQWSAEVRPAHLRRVLCRCAPWQQQGQCMLVPVSSCCMSRTLCKDVGFDDESRLGALVRREAVMQLWRPYDGPARLQHAPQVGLHPRRVVAALWCCSKDASQPTTLNAMDCNDVQIESVAREAPCVSRSRDMALCLRLMAMAKGDMPVLQVQDALSHARQ